jgi:hypothetical protein
VSRLPAPWGSCVGLFWFPDAGRPHRRARVATLLRANLLNRELPEVRGEFERHRALASELGMPGFAAGVCFSSIAGNYVPKEFIPKQHEGISFQRVGRA